MPNYKDGKIYTIRFYDNDKLIYIGSTTQKIANRYSYHKNDMKCSLYQHIQNNYNGDFKCCYIELLENYECNNKQELNKREGESIRIFKANQNYIVINKNVAGRTKQEYSLENVEKKKEYDKIYYENNVDKIKEYKKEYRAQAEYQEKMKEYQKEYRKLYKEKNDDKIKDYAKSYYEINKEKILAKQKQYRENKMIRVP